MAEKYDVVIVGAGLIGASLALLLAKKTDLKIALCERGQPLGLNLASEVSNQRVVALGAVALQVLDDVGVLAQLQKHQSHSYSRMYVWDENSSGELAFDAQELDKPELGKMVDALACTYHLQTAALAKQFSNLDCKFGAELTSLEIDGQGAILSGKSVDIRAGLVIGADGGQSWVRKQAKIFSNRHAYQQRGIVARIKTSEPHQHCAWQRFLSSGPLAILPVFDNYSSIVWSADNELADELMAMDEQEFSQALEQALEGKLGQIVELGQRRSFPLVSQRASHYVAPSLALVGDAAHSIHPLAGQGANLGFKDVAAVVSLLQSVAASDVGDVYVLSQYEAQRTNDNLQTDALMTALNRGYLNANPVWASLRGAGMNLVNHAKHLKQLLADMAIG